MAELFENFAESTLASGIGTGDTALSVASGDGALFPALSGGDNFHAVLVKKSNLAKEIVLVTARTGDNFTVTRAQQGTTALTLLAGDVIRNSVTRDYLQGFASKADIQGGGALYAAGGGTANAQTVTLDPVPTGYTAGMEIRWLPTADNTDAATLEANGLGAKAIKKSVDAALVDVDAGDIKTTHVHSAFYITGTDVFLLANPAHKTPTRQTYTGDATWTKPDKLLYVIVRAVGPGGGGGGAEGTSGQAAAAGGGGGGGYSEKLILASALGSTEAVAVGLGGAGGAAGDNDGSDGSKATSFGAHLSAAAGLGGVGGPSTTGESSPRGGAAGTATGGDITLPGSPGGNGRVTDGASARSGHGGTSWGGGARGGTTNSAGSNAEDGSGGGGSGGSTSNSGTDRAGGDGGDGKVVVDEFYA